METIEVLFSSRWGLVAITGNHGTQNFGTTF
jgi:hypothetical protein